jgi:hypothetical protein
MTTFLTGLVVGLHIASAHLPDNGENNFNPGIYARTESGWVAGIYNNSFHRPTAYLGKQWEWSGGFGPWSLALGGATGYDREVHLPITPLVDVSLRLPEVLNYTPRLHFVPGAIMGKPSVIHLSLERGF